MIQYYTMTATLFLFEKYKTTYKLEV